MTSMTRIASAVALTVVTLVASTPSFAGNSRNRTYYTTNADGVRVRAPYTRVYTDSAVRVRAPTSSVDVDPGYGGGVRVRAPYANVNVRW